MKTLAGLLAASLYLFGAVLLAAGQSVYDLKELTRSAQQNSPDINRLQSAAAVDRANLAGARAAQLPAVSMLNTFSYVGNPQAPYILKAGALGSIPLGGGKYYPLPESDVTVVPGLDDRLVNFAVTIDQPLFVWGKIRENIALHEKLIATDDLQVKKQRDETATMVTVNLYSLSYLDRIRALLEQQKQLGAELLSIAADALKAGQITQADLIEKRMAIDQIGHAILSVDEQRETALTNLRYLTGLTALSTKEISFAGLAERLSARPVAPEQELMARAAQSNSDLQLLQLAEQIHAKKVAITKSDTMLKPDLALNVRVGVMGSRIPNLQPDWESYDNWFATVTLAVSTNLYDGGKARSAVEAAQAQRRQAAEKTAATTRQIAKYIAQTRYELGVIRENIAYYRRRAADTEQIVVYQKSLLDHGAGSRLDYYQKRLDVFTERVEVLKQELGYATRYFTLMNVAGGPRS